MKFEDFIAPLDPATFRADYYDRCPVHINRSTHPGPNIFDWARFNAILSTSSYWNEDTLKLYFKSRAALRENYCDVGETRSGKAPVNPAKVKALIAVGASLVANHVQRVCPEIRRITSALEREFAARSFANIYCSFKGIQAFTTHFDLHDVFVFQAEGEKVWRVYETRAEAPVTPLPPGDEAESRLIESRGRIQLEICMKPGDILYIPRGQHHDALAQTGASLHVTFGVSPATGLVLFKLLETTLARERAFREYLPDARDEARLRQHLLTLATRMSEVATSRSFATDVLNHQRELAASSMIDYHLPTQEKVTWYTVAHQTEIIRRETGYTLVYEGGEIALGSGRAMVEWMMLERRFSSIELFARQAGFDRSELEVLLSQLLGAGIVVEVEMR